MVEYSPVNSFTESEILSELNAMQHDRLNGLNGWVDTSYEHCLEKRLLEIRSDALLWGCLFHAPVKRIGSFTVHPKTYGRIWRRV